MVLISTIGFSQGSTSSGVNGTVKDKDNVELPGAAVIIKHIPTGSTYSAVTNDKGYFRISNMRVGGPYSINVSYVGFQNYSEDNIFLQLGDFTPFNIVLKESINQIDEIVITGSKDDLINSKKTGAQTVVDRKQIEALPSLSRNISDFARLTPQAQVRGDDIISISGQNNRLNAIYIDGAVNNDVFGLAGNGTNGGQTGVSPISLDAIEQFQVQVAPFDVKISGFAGGAISAITKSGTNEFQGSAYFLTRNQNLSGMTPQGLVDLGSQKIKLPEFNASTYGVRAGGSIIKDKLFYFVNYERQDIETPQPFDIETYVGASKQLLKDNVIQDFIRNQYGYDVGGFTNNVSSLKSDKFIAKIDYNITDNHKLSGRYSLVKANNISPNRSSNNSINFLSGAQDFESTTHSASIELNSKFSEKISNNLVLGYTAVRDDRGFLGNPFPFVEIVDGTGSIFIGSEPFSTANLLNQDILTITNNLEITSGIHTITFGTHNEFSSALNVFFGRNFGDYRFRNTAEFLGNQKPDRFRINYSLVGGSGDNSLGAADFEVMQFGLYIQDEMRVSDNFRFSYGVRFDMPVWDDYIENKDFNERSVPLIEAAGYDLKGARVGQRIDSRVHFSPRLGFNYNVGGKKTTQIRGGAGVFTSRLPLVWPGGAYNNNGVTQAAAQITGVTNANMPFFNPNPSVPSQINGLPSSIAPPQGTAGSIFAGNIDLFAKDFRLPQVFKANIAVDQKLPLGFTLTSDFTWNDNISALKYENINLKAPTTFLTGADNRPRWNNVPAGRVDPTYLGVFLASNTDLGTSWNAAFTLSKKFRTEKIESAIQATYSYGESDGLFDGTSSQNSSQWGNVETVNGANRIGGVTRSDFDQGHRVLSNAYVNIKWNDHFKTKIGLFYEGAQGTPFSYTYNDRGNLLRDSFSSNALIFVPANQSQINLVTANNLSPQQQWEALDKFISSNPYLNSRRGQYAERNGDRLEWSHIVDLKFAQEFSINFGKTRHSFEATADIFNFTNLLNNKWGRRYFATFDQVQLLNHVGFLADGTTPTFNYNPNVETTVNQIDDAGLNSSRWQIQVGLRYNFN